MIVSCELRNEIYIYILNKCSSKINIVAVIIFLLRKMIKRIVNEQSRYNDYFNYYKEENISKLSHLMQNSSAPVTQNIMWSQ